MTAPETCSTAVIPEGARDDRLLKINPANPSNLEFTSTSPEKTQPGKRFERPPECLAGLIGEGFPCMKSVFKD